MNRRQTLRAAAAVGFAGMAGIAGCDSPSVPTAAGGPPGPSQQPSPLGSSSAAPTSAALPAEVVHGPRNRPAVALTFHGQGDPAMVKTLLTELESGGARVTVLAVGAWLGAQPAMARRVLDGGHELGNHTEHHLDIAGMPASQAFAEIDECARTLRRLTGSVGTWFRPSQTRHATALIRREAARVGYRTCLSYDVDSRDYTDPPPSAIVRNTLSAVRNGSIVSMHFGHAGTIAAIGEILDGLRRRGLGAITMTELVRP